MAVRSLSTLTIWQRLARNIAANSCTLLIAVPALCENSNEAELVLAKVLRNKSCRGEKRGRFQETSDHMTQRVVLDGLSHHRTTVADGIAALEREADFGPGDTARLLIGPLGLPDKRTAWLVALDFDNPASGRRTVLPLCTANSFSFSETGVRSENQPLEDLQGALVDFDGTVTLTDARRLRAVSLEATRLAHELTEREERIVRTALACMNDVGTGYYRSLRDYLPDDLKEQFPAFKMINYAKLAQQPPTNVPGLKIIQGRYQKYFQDDRPPSIETIATALAKCGLRHRTPRPRDRD